MQSKPDRIHYTGKTLHTLTLLKAQVFPFSIKFYLLFCTYTYWGRKRTANPGLLGFPMQFEGENIKKEKEKASK